MSPTNAIKAFRNRARRTGNVRIFPATLHDIEKALKPKVHTNPRDNCPDWLLPVIDAFDRKKASEPPPHCDGTVRSGGTVRVDSGAGHDRTLRVYASTRLPVSLSSSS